MNFNSEFNKENLLEIYSENKQFAVPLLTIIVSVFLLLFVIFPQVLSFPSNKSEADQETIRLNKMQKAYDFLSQSDEKTVDSNLTIAQNTLPDKKDFESVLNAITLAAGNSSTQILDYTFQDGVQSQTKYPTISFKIEIAGEIKDAIAYINALYKIYPLSNVTSLANESSTSVLQVSFYYRAFPPITADDRMMVSGPNQAQEAALKTISDWTNIAQGADNAVGSPSATSVSPF